MSQPRATKRLVAEPEPIPKIGRSERTRAEILDAAFEHLWSRPFRDMTVNSLMAMTSSTRSGFYRYFQDIHELMEALLKRLESELLEGVSPWLSDDGDPVALLYESLVAEVRICYRHGPFLKAVSDAAGTSARLEDEWNKFMGRFDDAVIDRITADQELGLIEAFDPRPVAAALNQVDASMYIRFFGQRPRSRPEPVQDAITRVWISTLYGQRWATGRKSTLYRKQVRNAREPRGHE
ncbi:MAG: TetR/AcrR family transcriptional regulator [Chromatiales bacterium]|jgi:AcrR family transcriptional regulator|nr:TetR/AcrR family transcriptional regulator [Chromatiales bacterium]